MDALVRGEWVTMFRYSVKPHFSPSLSPSLSSHVGPFVTFLKLPHDFESANQSSSYYIIKGRHLRTLWLLRFIFKSNHVKIWGTIVITKPMPG